MEQKKEEEKTLIVSSDYYSSSYIVNKVYLVTIKRYTTEHSLMIVDTTRADEHITIPLLSAIYRNLSRPDTDSLMITSFSQKLNRMDLVEIDTFNLLENNNLQLKIPISYENEEKKKKENLHPDQSRRNPSITEESEFDPSTGKPAFKENPIYEPLHVKYCKDCKYFANESKVCVQNMKKVDDFSVKCKKFIYNDLSASNNTERR